MTEIGKGRCQIFFLQAQNTSVNEGLIYLFFLENNSTLISGDQQHKDKMDKTYELTHIV